MQAVHMPIGTVDLFKTGKYICLAKDLNTGRTLSGRDKESTEVTFVDICFRQLT